MALREELKEAAAIGDVQAILGAYEEADDHTLLHFETEFLQSLRKALKVLGDKDPAKLATLALGRALSFNTGLLLRAQAHVDRELRKQEDQHKHRVGMPRDIEERWLPRISNLQAAVGRQAELLSRVTRQLTLADAKAKEMIHFPESEKELPDAARG